MQTYYNVIEKWENIGGREERKERRTDDEERATTSANETLFLSLYFSFDEV